MTDVNTNDYQSVSSRLSDETNNSFLLNQSHIPMDIDDNSDVLTANTTKINGHSSSTIENGNSNQENSEDIYHQG